MSDWVGGLPPSAHQRIEAQRASGVRGSLLSAPAVAALRAVGLEPVGEVFGCTVMSLGWQQGYCGAYSSFGGGFGGGIVGTFGGGIGGGVGAGYGRGGPGVSGWTTPVITSGSDRSAGFGPYVEAFETGWYGAVRRMVAEAKALGAEGVVGVRHERGFMEARVFEYTALGTAVRAVDPAVPASPLAKGEVWVSDLSPEDSAAAVRSGHLPLGVVLGMSVSTKHKDWALKQQESVWAGNAEIQGMTELISAARNDARRRITHRAQRFGGGDLVISGSELREFETTCRSSGGSEAEEDLHAEALFTGTVLAPPSLTHRRTRSGEGRVLTVMPLTQRTSRPRP